MRACFLATALLSLPTLSALAAQPLKPAVDPALYAGMKYRMVGPFRGGRSTAVAGIASQPHVYFMGTTGGGVWKTDDAGGHWTNLTDKHFDVGNVGAIDVADSDPNVIIVGTGSACIRGNVSVGRGIWRSTDGGASWKFAGLPESGAIGELLIHPTDPNLVYVAALGHPFGKNPERGVFRSKDGGLTWQKVLYLNDSTGAVSLAMNPVNPREIYAGMWRAERKPWTLISGGPEGGLYKTTDGGDNWTKVAGGLPTGVVGKVGVSISPSNPDRVWALIEAEPKGGLYRSDDGGKTWALINTDQRARGRPWYYTHVHADPKDENTVYVLNTQFLKSIDGGKTFEQIEVPHGDTHDLWINPADPGIYALADDGGVVVTHNDGKTFSSMYNQPTAELYDVMVDNQIPYRIYGSQQDNSSISVLHRSLHNTLRPQEEWLFASGCETGPLAFHPDHPETIWGGCYGGAINRFHVDNDTRVSVNMYPENQAVPPKNMTNRFQWVAPIVVSPHEPRTVYHASQYLYRSRDGGDNWERISPDLTTNDPAYQNWPGGPITGDHTGVEVFNTIFAVVPSPHDRNTIWVGTDDGRVHLTRDGGGSWSEITPREMPPLGTVNRVEVSAHAPGRAFLAVQRYRMDDFTPYVFRTDDFGRSWTRIANGQNGIPANHPVRVVREDPARKGLLYAGTEFAAFVSFDDGARWQPLQLNLPATPITDMKVHRHDLVLSTQGRSFWVLDDLTPLHELAASTAVNTAKLFTPRPAARGYIGEPLGELDHTRPDPLPHGALIHYYLDREVPSVSLEILDGSGAVLRTFTSDSAAAAERRTPRLSTAKGFHRVVWDLKADGPRAPRGVSAGFGGGGGVKMPPGTYRARLTAGGASETKPVVVIGNPKAPDITQADYDDQFRIAAAVRDTMNAMYAAVEAIRSAKDQSKALADRAKASATGAGSLPALADSLAARLARLEEMLLPARAAGDLASPTKLVGQYNTLYNSLVGDGGYGSGSAEGRPSPGRVRRKADLDPQWAAVRAQIDRGLAEEVGRFNAEVARLGLGGVVMPKR
ncbi:MAG: glycosyl hydrolase [Gemmatimonadetes bacterium]|nr:glycosyl hydrolase [Gemmatimonadota bacterium]